MTQELIKCKDCGRTPMTSVHGSQRRLEASVWCSQCDRAMTTVGCLSDSFEYVELAIEEACLRWNNRNTPKTSEGKE